MTAKKNQGAPSVRHTPGPWSRVSPWDVSAGKKRICFVVQAHADFGAAERAANADLIAAAPDLADALAGLLAHLGPEGYIPSAGEPATIAARVALRKAGRTP